MAKCTAKREHQVNDNDPEPTPATCMSNTCVLDAGHSEMHRCEQGHFWEEVTLDASESPGSE